MRRVIIITAVACLLSVQYVTLGSTKTNPNQSISPADTVGIRLTMSGESDKSGRDYIGQGANYFYSAADGNWTITAMDDNRDGVPEGVRFYFLGRRNGEFDGEFWGLDFSVRNVPGQTMLVPGTYNNAQRYPFEAAGHPGFDIGGDGRGCNTEFGSFTVLDATFDTSFQPTRVASFAATFDQACEGAPLHLKGTIIYNSNVAAGSDPPVISDITYIPKKGKLTIEGSNFDQSDVVVVDGAALSLSSSATVKIGKVIKIKGAIIPGGVHHIQVANYTGAISAPFTLLN